MDVALNVFHVEDQEQIMAVASHVSPESPPPFAVQLAAVEVDVETGQVTVTKLVTAVDCGVAINPVTASGQVDGAMAQALGYALTRSSSSTRTAGPSTAGSARTGSSEQMTCHRPRSS